MENQETNIPEQLLGEDIGKPEKAPAKKKKKSWKRIALIVLCCILALVLVVAVVMTIFVYRWLNMINRTDGYLEPMSSSEMEEYLQNNTDAYDPDFTGEVIDPEDIVWETTPEFQQSKNVVNILLVGSDTRVPGARARSDSLILCTFNRKTKTLTMTSLLRDLYLPIPGYQANRINASFVFGGLQLLNKTIETNFGIEIHGNFVIDFTGFADVIDVIGGVSITMNSAEANYMNTYSPPGSPHKGSFTAGTFLLNGDEALTYARMRKIDSDFGRTQRQRTVIEAAFKKCKDLSVTQLYRLLDQVLPLMTTDLTNGEILNLAADVIPIMSSLTINTQYIPANGTYTNAWVGKMLVLKPDLEANRRILWKIMSD